MLSGERLDQIKNELIENKKVSVIDLSEYFHVSLETIRRDLKKLEKDGVAKCIYGGAVLADRVKSTVDYQYLSNIMVETKKHIAQLAVQFIQPMDCIYIDFSTTCGQLSEFLGDIPINVMTSSLDTMNKVVNLPNVSLLSVGGEWDSLNRAFLGKTTVQTIKDFHLDKAFVSCRALNMKNGISDRSMPEAEVRKAIIESSNQVYLMVDNSKFDKMAFVKTGDFSNITAVITDMKPSDDWLTFFEKNNIECIY